MKLIKVYYHEFKTKIMITIIINDANFQPRVLTLPKEDFPQEMYQLLLSNSTSESENRHILYSKIIWKGNRGVAQKENWSHIIRLIYNIIEGYHDKPIWCKRGKTSFNHGYFNSKRIQPEKNNSNHETF